MLSVQEEVLSVRQEDIQAPNMEDFAVFPVLPSRPKAPLKQECVLCIRLGFRGQENAHSMDDCQRCAICKEWFADGLNEHGAECVEKERAAVKKLPPVAENVQQVLPTKRIVPKCKFFDQGRCTKGDECGFRHSENPLDGSAQVMANIRCFDCGGKHHVRDCQEPCSHCDSTAHTKSACRQCRSCDSWGHVAKDCTSPCSKCLSTEHSWKQCRKCTNCHVWGHKSASCPNCSECGDDHNVRNCPHFKKTTTSKFL